MTLDDTQKKTIAAWISDGLKLADIQKRIGSELGLNLTYMEVRLVVDDLKLMPKDPPPPPPPKAEKTAAPPGPDNPSPTGPLSPLQTAGDPGPASSIPGKISVAVDTLARPGALVSGAVTFSDGQTATWYLDQLGRMGVSPKQTGYKPTAADMQSFQQVLEQELSKLGF
jgi:hypothetical protein